MSVALITGGSRGFGRALGQALVRRGWSVVIDGRDAGDLEEAAAAMREASAPETSVTAIPGDVTSGAHREALAEAVARSGGLDLLVNNASLLGAPLVQLGHLADDVLRRLYEVNVLAPLALVQSLLPALRAAGGTVVNVSSDAAVEHYDTWGGYGSSKAALDHLTSTLAVEEPAVRWLSFDPGDMNTRMHEEACPGEDISDRPAPATVVPRLVTLLEGDFASGRYRAAEIPGAR
jgi:NAD(P)-dependent dehydrogenase (short-subunit alcohol dehydrogenase family)